MQKPCQVTVLRQIILLSMCFWVGCTSDPRFVVPDVVVGLPAIASMIQSVMAQGACDLSIQVLNPSTVQHTFELTPIQVESISRAPLTVVVGAAMDTWLVAAHPRKFIQIENWGVLKTFGPSQQKDPHFWLDPQISWTVASRLAQELHEQFPDRCDKVKLSLRVSEWGWQRSTFSKQMRETLEWLSGAQVVAIHDGFRYFVDFLASEGISVAYHPQQEQGVDPQQLSKILKSIDESQEDWVIWDVPPFSFCKQLDQRLGRPYSRCFRLDPTGSILNQQQAVVTYPEFFEHFLSGFRRQQP